MTNLISKYKNFRELKRRKALILQYFDQLIDCGQIWEEDGNYFQTHFIHNDQMTLIFEKDICPGSHRTKRIYYESNNFKRLVFKRLKSIYGRKEYLFVDGDWFDILEQTLKNV